MTKLPECSIQKRHYLTEQKYKHVISGDSSYWKFTTFLFAVLLLVLFV